MMFRGKEKKILPGSSSSEVFLSLRFIHGYSNQNASKICVYFSYLVFPQLYNSSAIWSCYLWRYCAASVKPDFTEIIMLMKIISTAFLPSACILPMCYIYSCLAQGHQVSCISFSIAFPHFNLLMCSRSKKKYHCLRSLLQCWKGHNAAAGGLMQDPSPFFSPWRFK